jgi:propanol-preferring alcohol dehydrogenase
MMEIPDSMQAMVFKQAGEPLERMELAVPEPGPHQILIKVLACGVCHTDLHIIDGELEHPKLPLIQGHEIIGLIARLGEAATRYQVGERVGVPWLGYTDQTCRFCQRGQENLCDHPKFTGYTIDGGFAEYAVADERYCFPIPESYTSPEAAPLMCAGLIGYRTYRMAGEHVERLGIYGFGAAAHIVAQIARHEGVRIFAFTRPGDEESQAFARRLGAEWAGGSDQAPPEDLDAALIFAPVGPLMVEALKHSVKGGAVVSGGIHMSDIPSFPYQLLWEERVLRSVANLTREDGRLLMELAPKVPIKTEIETFALDQANEVLDRMREGTIEGAAVLVISEDEAA